MAHGTGKRTARAHLYTVLDWENILMVDILRALYKKEIPYVFCVHICNTVGKVHNHSCRETEEDV